MKREEQIETLMQLGLTRNQARAYLMLLLAGQATAREVSELSKIARPDIYRVMPTLVEKGLIERIITNAGTPAKFQAIPVEDALPTMLKQRSTQQNLLAKKTEQFLRDFRDIQPSSQESTESACTLIPNRESVLKRLKRMLEAEHSVCMVTSSKRYAIGTLAFHNAHRENSNPDLEIKIVTDRFTPHEKVLRAMEKLGGNPKFQVKFLDKAPAAIVTIFDGKEACVTLSALPQHAEGSTLWSTDSSFIALAQSHFEEKWKAAVPVDYAALRSSVLETLKTTIGH